MKKIYVSSTLVTAAIAGALFLAPSRAQAASAHEKFVSMRSAISKALGDGELTVTGMLVGKDTASFSVQLYGSPLPPDVPVTVNTERLYGYTDYTVKIDFSDANFSSISFGKDPETLKLVPRRSPDLVDIVRLDPKTGKPLSWTEYKRGSSRPVATINYKSDTIQSNPGTRASTADPAPSDGVVTAHVRFMTQ